MSLAMLVLKPKRLHIVFALQITRTLFSSACAWVGEMGGMVLPRHKPCYSCEVSPLWRLPHSSLKHERHTVGEKAQA